MTMTYVANDPPHGRIQYRDRKRWWWLLSVVFPLLPFVGMAAHAGSGLEIALGLPLLISYGFLPLLDYLIGEDENNPPEAVVPQLEEDRYYRWLTWAAVPLHFVALIGCAWWVGTHALSWWAVLLFAYVAGTDSGLGLNTGHELGHKYTALEQWLARLVLAVPAYGHFTVEHGRGHHRWVSTPQDHSRCTTLSPGGNSPRPTMWSTTGCSGSACPMASTRVRNPTTPGTPTTWSPTW